MTRIVSPPAQELDKLKQKLTPGERLVFDFFDGNLSEGWEIYLQPHLNGLRPDFVLMNPRVGIAVFEVKDWDFQAMRYFMKQRHGKAPVLMAEKDGKTFSRQSDNPVEKIRRYKKEIHDLYCPRMDKNAGFAAITAGVIFPFSLDEQVRELLLPSLIHYGMDAYPQYNPISGVQSLQSGNMSVVFPEGMRSGSKLMREEFAKDLRNWLVEPSFASDQREPLVLDRNQKELATTRTAGGYRRVKGPAGSGKSLVLAARAAQLLSEGKEVLVITYNITLLHYLMDMAVRWPGSSGRTRKDVTWLNFHAWCKRVCELGDCEEEYRQLFRVAAFDGVVVTDQQKKTHIEKILHDLLPDFVAKVIDADEGLGVIDRYDAILVDEGQDMLPSWWAVLRKVCRPGGEMLLVADATQDIYGRTRSWTDDVMRGSGFVGAWATLKQSYRLPPIALKYARSFAEQFLPKDTVDLPEPVQDELDIFPCKMRWVSCPQDIAAQICVKEIFDIVKSDSAGVVSVSDVTFLCLTTRFGLDVVKMVGGKGVRCVHTFSDNDQESRRQKVGFYMGDARVKATTLHSFKGWEGKSLVVYVGGKISSESLALIYAGLTRIKRSSEGSFLTVVSSSDTLLDYGKTWPEFEEFT